MILKNLPLSADVLLSSSTIPVLDQNRINQLIASGQSVPNDYIKIPDTNLNINLESTCVVKETIDERTRLNLSDSGGRRAYSIVQDNPTVDKSYIDIMFLSLRALQSEVAKLRNTMRYGMYSYNDDKTAMSHVVDEFSLDTDNEPLWAIDESDLSELLRCSMTIDSDHSLRPSEYVLVGDGVLEISSNTSAKWKDDLTDQDCCKNAIDSKLLLYMTTSTSKIKLNLKKISDGDESLNVDLYDFGPHSIGKYNVLVIISRAFKEKTDKEYHGKNFVWISITDYSTLNKCVEGYWNQYDNKLYDDVQIVDFDAESEKEYSLSCHRYYFDEVEFTDPQSVYKFNMYTKYLNFQNEVLPNTPKDDTKNRYLVAHITIRSVKNVEVLQNIIRQLPQNELIYTLEDNGLYIVSETGKYKKISGGGSTPGETGMTEEQITQWLANNGIHLTRKVGQEGGDPITIDNLADITFINQDTNELYKFSCTSTGELKSLKIIDSQYLLQSRINASGYENYTMKDTKLRGFVGNLRAAENNSAKSIFVTDAGLMADRIKIASIYAPNPNLSSTYGCSHAFIELENTSEKDFSLDGCYLHLGRLYLRANDTQAFVEKTEILSLRLTGILPAGGTYLIRGKQYVNDDSANCFIHVNEYDIEWYVNNNDVRELIDLTLAGRNTYMLTYGMPENLSHTTKMIDDRDPTDEYIDKSKFTIDNNLIDIVSIGGIIQNVSTGTGGEPSWQSKIHMGKIFEKQNTFDCIYKNTFELDPAKLAFLSLFGKDSSRVRNTNLQDFQYLDISKDVIEFPKTAETFKIDNYTPKASYLHKNVSTDKTKLDMQKPNAVTCSFGLNINKDRCFNWVSAGLFDEYIWLRKKTAENTEKWARFESYKSSTTQKHADSVVDGITKKNFPANVKPIIYDRITNVFPGCNITYTSHKCVINLDFVTNITVYEYVVGRANKSGEFDVDHCSSILTFTLYPMTYTPRIFLITDQQGFHWIEYQAWAAAAKELNKSIEFSKNYNIVTTEPNIGSTYYDENGNQFTITNDNKSLYWQPAGYIDDSKKLYSPVRENDRIPDGTAPVINTYYFALKTDSTTDYEIIQITNQNISTYWNSNEKKYIKNIYNAQYGELILDPKLDDTTHVLYACNNKNVILKLISESEINNYYSSSAYAIKSYYEYDEQKIIPVLINTGDMTQNGTRINEWLDYYNAGKCLFDHLEQMNVVGNNDLCGPNPTELGTGDDPGKSNAYYFHVFYCYDIPIRPSNDDTSFEMIPIYNNKYIPSFYYFENTVVDDSNKFRFLMLNSEITTTTCEKYFDAKNAGRIVNVYTGWEMLNSNEKESETNLSYVKKENTKYIYDMIYEILQDALTKKYKTIAVCHEMPFTVITDSNISKSLNKSGSEDPDDGLTADRSLNGDSLVGCHMNRLGKNDIKSNYWFSRLLEFFKVQLCIGGHKHTYACTYPIKELYKYSIKNGETTLIKYSIDGAMTMLATLETDTIEHKGITVYAHKYDYTEGSLTQNRAILTLESKQTGDKTYLIDSSKFPLISTQYKDHQPDTNKIGIHATDGTAVYPFYEYEPSAANNYEGVTYFMLLATGYKLKSNKELPSPLQDFAYILPMTTPGTDKDTPDDNQQYPMFAEILLGDDNSNKYKIYLYRMLNILCDTVVNNDKNSKHGFTQQYYGNKDASYEYMILTYDAAKPGGVFKYGNWRKAKNTAVEITMYNENV